MGAVADFRKRLAKWETNRLIERKAELAQERRQFALENNVTHPEDVMARVDEFLAGAQTRFQNFRANKRSAVATDFDQIFARVTCGRTMD